MSTPLTSTQFLNALRLEGVRVVEHTGWRTRNRNHKGAWGPVHGIMNHHTVTGPKVDAVPICTNGYAELPGPLCIGVVKRDGSVHLVGYGRTNHAGGGDPNVLQAVIDERYNATPPAPHQHQGSAGAVDGNPHFYGFEFENAGDGKDPWPAAQVDAIVRLNAAITRAHRAKGDDWGPLGKSSIGHLEWSDWKNDPRGPGWPGMPRLRERIAQRLAHSASWDPTQKDDKMAAPIPLVLSRPEDTQILPGETKPIYFTVEHSDPAGQHGAGGKTVMTNGQYTGTITVGVSGLNHGEGLEVFPSEEDASGAVLGLGDAHVIHGVGGEGSAPVQVGVSVTGSVSERLVVRVKNLQETEVLVTFVRANLKTWPNA